MRTTPLAHDLNPLHQRSPYGCHSGSLIRSVHHVTKQSGPQSYQQDGRRRTDTAVVARLQKDGAIPAAYAVENYGYGAATISATETAPESLNAVALWLAKNAPVRR